MITPKRDVYWLLTAPAEDGIPPNLEPKSGGKDGDHQQSERPKIRTARAAAVMGLPPKLS